MGIDLEKMAYIDEMYKLTKKLKRFPTGRELANSFNISLATLHVRMSKLYPPLTHVSLIEKTIEKHPELKDYPRKFGVHSSKPKDVRKQELIDLYAKECIKQKKIVGPSRFSRISGSRIESYFLNSGVLVEEAKKKYPELKNYLCTFDKDAKQNIIVKKYAELCKKHGYEISSHECRVFNLYIDNYMDGKIEHIRAEARKMFPTLMKNVKTQDEKTMDEYIKKYIKLSKRYRIQNKGILPNWKFLEYFKKCPLTQEELRKEAIKRFPEEFKDDVLLKIENTFTKDRYIELQGNLKKYKMFFITTYVAGQPINMEFYESIKQFCKTNNALLLVMVANKKYEEIDEDFLKENIVFTPELYDKSQIINQEIKLNDNIHLSTIPIPAKQIRTLTGLERLTVIDNSMIVAAPKQFLKYVPVQKTKPARAIMSTGAITNPYYDNENFYQKRTDYIAHEDHQIGGIIVEIESDEYYHFRQVIANQDGSFYDLHTKYTPQKSIEIFPEAFVMGDLHSRQKDDTVFNTWIDCIKNTKPKKIVLHDVFDGISISHHNIDRNIHKAILSNEGLLNLENEIKILVDDLTRLSTLADDIVVVKSNHDEHLERYLEEGRYTTDPLNYTFASKLVPAMMEKKDVIQYACELCGLKIKNIIWLSRKQEYYIAETQLGYHGDFGANGGKGGVTSIENAFPNSVIGHSHSPRIWRSVYQIGTTSKLDMGYNQGLSSWMHTSCLVHRSGARQLINCINNNWRLKKHRKHK